MSDITFRTIRVGKGAHASPARGACVMELASMLAGERFSDHPKSACPVIAGFLRSYNDLLPDGEHRHLYPLAALVVGSASTWSVRRRRTLRLLEWAGLRDRARRDSVFTPTGPRHEIVLAAARAAIRIDPPQRRRAAVAELLDELVAMGRTAAAPPPVPAAVDDGVHADARSSDQVTAARVARR